MRRAAVSVAEVLGDLARALREVGKPWYVFGAHALVLRGFPRATADVDATVLWDEPSSARLVRALEGRGFAVRSKDAAFIRATRVLPIVHRKSRLPVDLVLGGPGLEELFASRAEPIRAGRATVPVATATDLVVMKVLAGREKDLEDAAVLVRAADVRSAEVRRLVQDLARALGESDIEERWELVRRRARARPRGRC